MTEIDKKIEELEKKLNAVKGTPCEIFTRICGYHRTTTKWNQGKIGELKARKEYKV